MYDSQYSSGRAESDPAIYPTEVQPGYQQTGTTWLSPGYYGSPGMSGIASGRDSSGYARYAAAAEGGHAQAEKVFYVCECVLCVCVCVCVHSGMCVCV
jgi:hypothetical protein